MLALALGPATLGEARDAVLIIADVAVAAARSLVFVVPRVVSSAFSGLLALVLVSRPRVFVLLPAGVGAIGAAWLVEA